ncbi:MAG TPA: RNA degradosome polyphosphate kinase, partial [Croceibacterium sp.]|nr:RNA degradosome polyphosphate kinase [Croceibacterium sp.]
MNIETRLLEAASDEARYFNRELSWLAFNERVLAESLNENYPLLERLRFLSISGSNLDEFMMIRVAGLAGQVKRQIERLSIDGLTPAQQLAVVRGAIARLKDHQQSSWRKLRPLLAAKGIHVAYEKRIDNAAARWLRTYFLDHVAPVITPQAIDPAHPFPF